MKLEANAEDKLPRNHAYIHMRNAGASIHIDYPMVDSAQAKRIIDAVMAIVRDDLPLPPAEKP